MKKRTSRPAAPHPSKKASRTKPRPTRSPEVLPPEEETSSQEPSSEDELVETEADEPSDEDLAAEKLEESRAPVPIDPDIGAISPTDPLRRYLEEVRRYPLLTPEEEFQLAMRLKSQGDLHAAKTLVSANLRLVVKIAFEYQTIYANLLDLIQEGNIGLMKAVSKFDPAKNVRLGYYASWWIRSYILKYILDNFRLVKVGTTQAQKKLFYHLMREKERLEAQGLLAGPKLLAEKLHVREKDVVEMEQRLSSEVSLDAPIGEEDQAASRIELLPDENEAADEALARQELLKLLKDRLPEFEKTLNDKERRVLQERLLSEEPKTLQEVADAYGLTRERARQIEAKVIQKLREFLRPAF